MGLGVAIPHAFNSLEFLEVIFCSLDYFILLTCLVCEDTLTGVCFGNIWWVEKRDICPSTLVTKCSFPNCVRFLGCCLQCPLRNPASSVNINRETTLKLTRLC